MTNKLVLGTTDDQGQLYAVETFTLDQSVPLCVTVEADGVKWSNLLIRDPKHRLRAQILDVGKQEWYRISDIIATTSPQAIPGEMIMGDWQLEISIQSAPHSEVSFIWKQDETDLPAHNYASIKLEDIEEQISHMSSGPKWYKCDMHTHTTMSDGKMMMRDNQRQAQKMLLDFYVATDHNITPSSWLVGEDLPVVFPGIEVTSPLGHFNLLFANDYIFNHHDLADMNTPEGFYGIIETIKTKNMGLFSINHPFLTVWKWLLMDVPLAWVDSIEIINDPTYAANGPANLQTLKFWFGLLSDGHRIPIVGGSDSHLRPDDRYEGSVFPSVIGDPGTYIYSESLQSQDLMASIRQGHVVVSRFGFLNVEFGQWMAGDQISEDMIDDTLKIVSTYECTESSIASRVELVLDGEVIESSTRTDNEWDIEKERLNEGYHWLVVTVYDDETGDLLSVTNPLYIGEKEPSLTLWQDALMLVPDSTSNT